MRNIIRMSRIARTAFIGGRIVPLTSRPSPCGTWRGSPTPGRQKKPCTVFSTYTPLAREFLADIWRSFARQLSSFMVDAYWRARQAWHHLRYHVEPKVGHILAEHQKSPLANKASPAVSDTSGRSSSVNLGNMTLQP